jgi:hypothetical protein
MTKPDFTCCGRRQFILSFDDVTHITGVTMDHLAPAEYPSLRKSDATFRIQMSFHNSGPPTQRTGEKRSVAFGEDQIFRVHSQQQQHSYNIKQLR